MLRWLMRLLALTGLALSLYLLAQVYSQQPLPGCGPHSSCDTVLSSRWSKWLGMPVSALAAVLYLAALGALAQIGPGRPPRVRSSAWSTLVCIASMLALGAVWFVALQFHLKSICLYCMSAHGVGFVLAALILATAPIGTNRAEITAGRARDANVPPKTALGVAGLGLLAFGVLVAGQVFYKPSNGIGDFIPSRPATQPAPAPTGISNERTVSLLGSLLNIDPAAYPVLGSAQAPHIIAVFFDYTCEYCREVHRQLEEVRPRYGAQLGIISIVIPNETRCNPSVTVMDPRHRNACEYARLSLAVWHANPSAYAKFDGWLMTGSVPPGLDRARAFAADLVGSEALEQALADPRLDQEIQRNLHLQRQSGTGLVPQIAAPGGRIVGRIPAMGVLYDVFENRMGMKPLATIPTRP